MVASAAQQQTEPLLGRWAEQTCELADVATRNVAQRNAGAQPKNKKRKPHKTKVLWGKNTSVYLRIFTFYRARICPYIYYTALSAYCPNLRYFL